MPKLATRIGVLVVVIHLLAASHSSARDQIDLRHRSGPEVHEIGFCANEDSITGHAFISLSKRDEVSGRRTYLAIGHVPESQKKTLLGSVPGGVEEEVYTSRTQDCFFVLVDREPFQRVETHVEQSRHREYYLLIDDCVVFVQEVAGIVGIKVAERASGITPMGYIAALQRLNLG